MIKVLFMNNIIIILQIEFTYSYSGFNEIHISYLLCIHLEIIL